MMSDGVVERGQTPGSEAENKSEVTAAKGSSASVISQRLNTVQRCYSKENNARNQSLQLPPEPMDSHK